MTCVSATGLAAGGMRTITIHVTVAATVDSGTILSNSASVAPSAGATTDPNPGNNSTPTAANTTVQEDVRLAIVKTFTEGSVTAGTPGHSFTIAVTNNGVSDADNLVVTDTVNASLSRRLPSRAVASPAPTAPSQTISCTLAHLAPSTTKTITVTYTAANAGAGTTVQQHGLGVPQMK